MPARTTVMFALVAIPAFAASPGPIEAHYECSTGTRLSATFSSPTVSPGSVILVFAGARRLIILPQVVSADGGRYANSEGSKIDARREARNMSRRLSLLLGVEEGRHSASHGAG